MKRIFSFEGRIARKEYAFSLLVFFTSVIMLKQLSPREHGPDPFYIRVLVVPILWFVYAQGAKRCHDMNITGWYQIIPGSFIVFLFAPPQNDNNNYGSNPS